MKIYVVPHIFFMQWVGFSPWPDNERSDDSQHEFSNFSIQWNMRRNTWRLDFTHPKSLCTRAFSQPLHPLLARHSSWSGHIAPRADTDISEGESCPEFGGTRVTQKHDSKIPRAFLAQCQKALECILDAWESWNWSLWYLGWLYHYNPDRYCNRFSSVTLYGKSSELRCTKWI